MESFGGKGSRTQKALPIFRTKNSVFEKGPSASSTRDGGAMICCKKSGDAG